MPPWPEASRQLLEALPRRLALSLGLAAWLVLAGCAGLPPPQPRPATQAHVLDASTELGRFALKAALPEGESGFWGLPQADFALDARVQLIRHAQQAIDLQTYQIGNDAVGRLLLRELRDAAARGVRVRLLVDDFYTLGLDAPLRHLAAHAGVEVRLFNPFMHGRESGSGRFWNLLTDGRRLNHRMHNKLLLADGALAVAGGRNLTAEYFMRSADGNFLDIDFLIAGQLVPQLGGIFDRYWNHPRVFDIRQTSPDARTLPQQREAFAAWAAQAPAHVPPSLPDMMGQRPLWQALAQGMPRFRAGRAQAFADAPDKTYDPKAPRDEAAAGSTLAWVEGWALQSRSESLLISPYFLPDQRTRARLQEGTQRGVRISVLSNSIASSDEPLVAYASHRYRHELLAAGVRLYELNPRPKARPAPADRMPEGSALRLHAKLALFDRRYIGIGSVNLDPRSHRINTELAVLIDAPALASDMANAIEALLRSDAAMELKLTPSGLSWHRPEGQQVAQLTEEPGFGVWQRLRLWFFYLLVPDELL